MRKNRIMPAKTAASGERSAWIAGLLVLAGVMAIVNILANTSCNQLSASIGAMEESLRKLDDDCHRESTRLSDMQTPEKLVRTLRQHGMAMNVPQPHQTIKMSRSGRPYPGAEAALRRLADSQGSTAQVRRRK